MLSCVHVRVAQRVLSPEQIALFYLDGRLGIPKFWNLSRKHFRLETLDGRFIKLNKIANRITENDLKYYCWKFRVAHVYFSVIDWLFPERVGKKRKAVHCAPLNGNYVVDVDSYMFYHYRNLTPFRHEHIPSKEWQVASTALTWLRR